MSARLYNLHTRCECDKAVAMATPAPKTTRTELIKARLTRLIKHPSCYQYEAFTPVKIGLGSAPAVTFYTPAATAERFKGDGRRENPPT